MLVSFHGMRWLERGNAHGTQNLSPELSEQILNAFTALLGCCSPLPQMKSYSRDWMVPGRVRVKLRNDDGSPVNPEIPSRE